MGGAMAMNGHERMDVLGAAQSFDGLQHAEQN